MPNTAAARISTGRKSRKRYGEYSHRAETGARNGSVAPGTRDTSETVRVYFYVSMGLLEANRLCVCAVGACI